MRRVVVSGLGLQSPIGSDLRSVIELIGNPRSALVNEDFENKAGKVRKVLMARVPKLASEPRRHGFITEDRSVLLSRSATEAALNNANLLSAEKVDFRKSMSVFVGTGVGPIHSIEAAFANWQLPEVTTYPLTVVRGLHNGIAAEISIRFGIQGPARTFAMACASSGVAIASAVRDIRAGVCTAAIVCGADTPLSKPMIDAWLAMRVYASSDSCVEGEDVGCVPFSQYRTGLALAECAATLIIEDLDSVRARGHEPIAEILGCGETSDAAHMTAPSRDAQISAMRLALRDAGIPSDQIAYVNAHATGTVAGDIAEAESLAAVFSRKTLVSSTKSIHGHTLGAAGTLEAILSIATLVAQCAPPTFGLKSVDPKCDQIQHIVGDPSAIPPGSTCLSNSFAFGGHNVSLVLRAI
ncbi:MAG: beta-ketoacyl-[acyl-carrier-protein] synthase family protein [Casimicrobium sp.]